ncbi:MAG: hypothetical protein ACM336_10705 [Acidobacteriota bacterium]
MKRLLPLLCVAAACAYGQYKLEPAGAPPSELSDAVRGVLQKDGSKITGPNGVVCEIWLRTSFPAGSNSEQNVSFSNATHGTLLGAVRYATKGTDRRGQPIPPGVYTMRLSFYPVDGAHQGVAPTRDFLVLSPAASDTDPASTPAYAALMDMSRKASGTRHPSIMNAWKPDAAEASPELKEEGEDWVLYNKIGDVPIAIIVVGVHQG